MCGIVGIAGLQVRHKVSALKKMADAIAHRGPDDEGYAAFDNCILGHRRLSIVDLRTGQQPMHSPYGASIVFNGEFYGFQSIKNQLPYPYQSTSDTEVILALYHKYAQEEMLQHMRGMFSFAIWDEKKQQLFAARDRFGEKPFYYAITADKEMIFASEIKSILASAFIKPALDPEALTHYLQHLYVHPHHTIYKNIYVLPPAHYLTFSNGEVHVKPYWRLPQQQLNISFDDAKQECFRLLSKAVEQQMIADVPVGCFLSGGLDSSTITALASQYVKQPLTSISFSFGASHSELAYSRQIAKKYKTHTIELHQDDYDIAQWFEQMIAVYDEPFADSSNIPTYLISKMASSQLKVVLTGDGGDELLGGYASWYRPLYQLDHPNGCIGRLKNSIKKYRHPIYRSSNIASIHVKQNTYFDEDEIAQIYHQRHTYTFSKFLNQPYNSVDAAMRMDLLDYMPGDILVKTDRAAMANGLELRAPFLDVDFAEFCICLPEEYKMDNNTNKIILRETFQHLWTKDIAARTKQGFGAPIAQWLQQSKMQQLQKDYLLNPNSKLYAYMNYDACQKWARQYNYKTWILLTLAVWMDHH